MATCTVKLDLNEIDDKVVEYYKLLMETSTGQESVYLKAKETLNSILDDAGITGREKADILSKTIANMVNGISAQSMQSAIDLAKDNRNAEYELGKVCADIELSSAQKDKIVADTADTEMSTKFKTAQGWLVQAQLYRDFGAIPDQLVYTKEDLDNVDYDVDYGTKHESIRLAQGNVYNTYANAFRQSGEVSLAYKTNGDLDAATAGDTTGLTYWQTQVAERQYQGFDDNMRQHVANSSASMISMLLSTEAADIDYDPYLVGWKTAIEYLNESTIVVDGTANNGQ